MPQFSLGHRCHGNVDINLVIDLSLAINLHRRTILHFGISQLTRESIFQNGKNVVFTYKEDAQNEFQILT